MDRVGEGVGVRDTTGVNSAYVAHPWVAEGARRVRFGLYGGLTPDWSRSLEWVQLAEELGFDSFWLPDHPVAHGRDCWTYLAALATGTRRIRLGSLVSCVYYRPTALLARIVADVDMISNGRIVLGLGIGDVEREFAQLGLVYPPVRERQAALGDALQVLPRLLGGEEVTLWGTHVRVDGAVIRPGPSQEPRVPILVAGGGEKVTLRHVAQYADASNFGAGDTIGNAWTLDDVRRKYLALQGHCEDVGRPYDSVLRTYFGGVVEFGESVQTREEHFSTAAGQYLVLHGDPKGALAHYRALVDAGVRYFIIVGLSDAKALRLFADQVVLDLAGT
jgi:alkanesulfonate monooxygenase SsuD/methylene tetrahydromethanopterin reductase-like flavin-dependent oxidoreductase (luciferase family)